MPGFQTIVRIDFFCPDGRKIVATAYFVEGDEQTFLRKFGFIFDDEDEYISGVVRARVTSLEMQSDKILHKLREAGCPLRVH
jgi:hypothetical protein